MYNNWSKHHCVFQPALWNSGSFYRWLRSPELEICRVRCHTATYWRRLFFKRLSLRTSSTNFTLIKNIIWWIQRTISILLIDYLLVYNILRLYINKERKCPVSQPGPKISIYGLSRLFLLANLKRKKKHFWNLPFCLMDDLYLSRLGITSANKPDLTLPCTGTSGTPQRQDQRPCTSLDSICARHAQRAHEQQFSAFQSSSSAPAVFISLYLFLQKMSYCFLSKKANKQRNRGQSSFTKQKLYLWASHPTAKLQNWAQIETCM